MESTDAAVIAVLIALVTVFGSVMVALLLFIAKSFNDRITENAGKISCVDKKVRTLATLITIIGADRLKKHENPLKMGENETITQFVNRIMNMP